MGEGDDVVDALAPRDEGDEAVEAEGVARGGRHALLQRAQEVLVERVDGQAEVRASALVLQEAGALLGGVRELVEGVTELDAGDVELRSQADAGVVVAAPRERGVHRREVREKRRSVEADAGLDVLREAAEVLLLVGGGEGDGVGDVRRPAREGLAHGHLRELLLEGDLVRAEADHPRRWPHLRDRAHEVLGVGQHVIEARPRAVPLDHGELRLVPPPDLARAEAARELEAVVHAADEQPLQVQLRRGDQEPVRRRQPGRGGLHASEHAEG